MLLRPNKKTYLWDKECQNLLKKQNTKRLGTSRAGQASLILSRGEDMVEWILTKHTRIKLLLRKEQRPFVLLQVLTKSMTTLSRWSLKIPVTDAVNGRV